MTIRKSEKYLRQELNLFISVDECSDGAEAHKFILTQKPDLVLTDIITPYGWYHTLPQNKN